MERQPGDLRSEADGIPGDETAERIRIRMLAQLAWLRRDKWRRAENLILMWKHAQAAFIVDELDDRQIFIIPVVDIYDDYAYHAGKGGL